MKHQFATMLYKIGYLICLLACRIDGIDKSKLDEFWFNKMREKEL